MTETTGRTAAVVGTTDEQVAGEAATVHLAVPIPRRPFAPGEGDQSEHGCREQNETGRLQELWRRSTAVWKNCSWR